MATILDVARAAGVSPITVSRVFQQSPNVRPETRARVLQAASELHYVPNAVAAACARPAAACSRSSTPT